MDAQVVYESDQWTRQRNAYENRWRFSDEEMPDFNDLPPEEQMSVCERCGSFLDPEMPINEDEPILCGGDVCDEEQEVEEV